MQLIPANAPNTSGIKIGYKTPDICNPVKDIPPALVNVNVEPDAHSMAVLVMKYVNEVLVDSPIAGIVTIFVPELYDDTVVS